MITASYKGEACLVIAYSDSTVGVHALGDGRQHMYLKGHTGRVLCLGDSICISKDTPDAYSAWGWVNSLRIKFVLKRRGKTHYWLSNRVALRSTSVLWCTNVLSWWILHQHSFSVVTWVGMVVHMELPTMPETPGWTPSLSYKCTKFFYLHYTKHRTYGFTSCPKDEAIMVKCLA